LGVTCDSVTSLPDFDDCPTLHTLKCKSQWERQAAEKAEKERLIGTADYQIDLFDNLPEMERRDKILDI
jgi:hypothetical protein